jgi:hypothetical protein
LSYVALRDVAARTHAVPGNLAWLTPICVDGAVLAASSSIWASSMRGVRKDPFAFLTVVALLTVSVIINVNHAGPAVLAKVIAALPPLTLLACLELAANQYRIRAVEDATKESTVPAAAELSAPAESVAQASPAVPVARSQAAYPAKSETVPAVPLPSVSADRPAPPVPAPPVPAPPVPTPPVPAPAAVRPAASAAAPRQAARPLPVGSAGNGADKIRALLTEHLAGGGDPTDPTLARQFAAASGLNPQYVRRVLGPLRRELATS